MSCHVSCVMCHSPSVVHTNTLHQADCCYMPSSVVVVLLLLVLVLLVLVWLVLLLLVLLWLQVHPYICHMYGDNVLSSMVRHIGCSL